MKNQTPTQMKNQIENLNSEIKHHISIIDSLIKEKKIVDNDLQDLRTSFTERCIQFHKSIDLIENNSTQMVNDLKHEKIMLLVELDKAKNWASLRNNQVQQLIDSVHSLTKNTNGKH